ncbi:TIGR02680 family protein [Streptomyces sp. NPDC006967]|uniref:TIGR02680 family protein n=4 Tax=Streptomyces TaxID=1883 RepID=UPI0033F8A5D0
MNRPPSPHRYRLHRAGIRNVWQYDHQEFTFGEGRLLLRGKNGAGKSKALEMLLPYLLDGDARALDATGTGRTTLAWLMLDGFARTNRLGYLWLEFARTDEESGEQHLTVGAAVRASQSTRTAKPFFFTTGLRVGEDLDLAPAGQPLPVDRLKTLVGPENVTDRAVEHRARVARDLFGLTDPARYRNLLHLLHRLRRPTIGDRIDSGGLVQVLAETLPGLDDEVVEKVARSLDDLDSVRAHLGRLERTDRALHAFLTGYRGYLHGALRRRTDRADAELERLRKHRGAADDAARTVEELRGRERELDARIDHLVAEQDAAGTDLSALHASAGYRSLRELGEKRATVTALHSAADAAFRAVRQAHLGEEEAGRRLTAEAGRLGAELVELSTAHAESVREAERAGLDPVHLGEPVATPVAPVAPATTAHLTAPDGDFHLIRHGEVLAVDTGICTTALQAWDARLDAAQPVIRNRARFVTELAALIERSDEARREADAADAARERLEAQVEYARTRAEQRRQETASASETYAEEAGAWAGRLRELTGLPLDEVLAPLAHDPSEGPLPARTPDEVAETARSVVEPWLADLGEERDTLSLAVRALEAEREDLRRRYAEWERRTDPEPPPPPHRAAPRTPGTGAPLYRLVDFVPGLPPDARAGLEAALEASGLLDAWVRADGTVLDPATHDTLLIPGTPVTGPSLTRVLRPVAAPDSGVTAEQVRRVLESVVLAEGAAGPHSDADTGARTTAGPRPHTAAGTDGSWRLGIARGRHLKQAAEYVGAEVRAETRRRALADLDRRLADADAALEERRQTLRVLTENRDRVGETLRRPPSARELTDAWARTAEAEGTVESLTAQASTAAREAQRARAGAVAARRETEATASAQDLPADPAALATVRLALDRLGRGTRHLRRRVRAVLDAAEGHRDGRADHERAVAARREAETDYAEPLGRLETARRTVRALEEALGATEQQILAHEAEAKRRLDAVGRQLPRLRDDRGEVHDRRVRAEEDDRKRRETLAAQEEEVLACGRRLRAALALPGLLRGAGLDADADEGALKSPDPVHHDVRERVTALDRLTGAVCRGLDAERHDLSDTALLNRHTELRDQLSGGYDATLEEHDGIKLCRLVNDQGPSDVAQVGARIAAEAAEARDRLTERESEVFQRFLAGELGDHLSAQVLAAGALITALNTTLATVRTSHGLGVTLDWKLADGVEADVKAAVDLLRSPSGLRTREQSEQLRDVLQRRIEDARRADPAAGYAAHLRTALDYRGWFTFTPWVVDDAAPGSRRKLSGRTGLSQGEQRVLSYLVLFAAAAAHFTGLADAVPHAPRLILLDDAFAKVDEPTHARLGRILVDLDLDFVLTSERLIGNWPDVPSLHIYECLRDPHVRGVATLHYTWNGRQRRLMPV